MRLFQRIGLVVALALPPRHLKRPQAAPFRFVECFEMEQAVLRALRETGIS